MQNPHPTEKKSCFAIDGNHNVTSFLIISDQSVFLKLYMKNTPGVNE
jgi:hypothetical protein